MKPKHLGLVSLFMIVLVVGFSSWYLFYGRGVDPAAAGFKPIKPLSELAVPDAPVLAQMDVLERSMHLLAAPPRSGRRTADLSVLGYVPVTVNGVAADRNRADGPALRAHRVTLAFDGQGKRFCVIDRELYPEGAVLPDGATILKIESRRVLIAKEQRQRWLMVESVLDSALPDQS